MKTGPTGPDRSINPPWAALGWALVFDAASLFALAAVGGLTWAVTGHPGSWLPPALAGGGLLAIAASLRRGCTWAWACQLALLCLATAVTMPLGIVIVPLLVAWCGPSVRDWFDPPLGRDF